MWTQGWKESSRRPAGLWVLFFQLPRAVEAPRAGWVSCSRWRQWDGCLEMAQGVEMNDPGGQRKVPIILHVGAQGWGLAQGSAVMPRTC